MKLTVTMPAVPPSTYRLDELERNVERIRGVVDRMLTMLDKLTSERDEGESWKK